MRTLRHRTRRTRGHGFRLAAALVTAALLTAATGSAASATTAPNAPFPPGDAFYAPPSPLPAGSPGDVLRWRPATIGKLFGVVAPAAADAYQMMYLSSDDAGRRIAVTGTVFVPRGPTAPGRPIIGYAPSTHGIADNCAASRELVVGTDTDLININDAITRGWAVADTDYQGLGTPGGHTYVVGRAEGHAVLDAVRAAQRLTVAGLPPAGPVGLWGYSQGGGSVGWAAQLAGRYAPELRIKGTAAGGTPADLKVVADNLNNGINPGFAFLMMAAGGLDAAYPELNLQKYLNAAGRAALVDLSTGDTCVNQAISRYAFGTISRFTTTNPLDRPDWQARIDRQKIGRIRPSAPVLLYHGLQDEFIPLSQAVELRKDWCARGQRITFKGYLGDHFTTFVTAQVDAENFLADRLADRPAPSSC